MVRRPDPRTALTAVLGLLVVVGLVATALLARTVLDDRRRAADGEAAVAAATQLGVNFTTLDYRTFDRDARRVLDEATGTFRKEFEAQTSQLKQLVSANKAVSKGKVVQAGLVSHDADDARVLLVVDADVTNTAATTPVARHYRIQVDLSRSGDRWLANQLQFVG